MPAHNTEARQALARHFLVRALQVGIVTLIASAPTFGEAPQFSAAAEYSRAAGVKQPPPTSSAKLYVGHERIRIDFAGIVGHSLIVDEAAHTIVAVLPDQKAYQQLASRPAEYFRIPNSEDACAAWQRAVGAPIRCEKSGPEQVAGRQTIHYTRTTQGGSVDEIWVDPTLQFPIKWRIDGIGVTLHDIQMGVQPVDRFLVPDGYGPVLPSKKPSRAKRL